MKYNEFIHVNKDFNPVYDLEDEKDNAWKLFIPNDKFKEVLTSVIDSLDINKQKKPVWLQGTYGTGKSHATSVIKHLLTDEDISSFKLGDAQLEAKLNNFRAETKVLPIVIKGTGTIGTSGKFRTTIQTAIKNTLKENDMQVTIPSDFEQIIKLLDENITLQEKDIKGTILEAFDLEEIKSRLKKQESNILIAIEEILEKKGIVYFQGNIVEWLSEIKNELNKKYGIDYLMIFWDEFTGALNQPNVEDILLEIQNIAEAKTKGLSLLIVSHRTRSTQSNINEEILEKSMDRFKRINYIMEPIATYELMERSITKDESWKDVKDRYINKIKPLIKKISNNEGPKVEEALENLYPIHPYTSFLATFIAREIGSTERSIFRFIHDDSENGFKQFIDTYEINQRYYLTAEYLWDFFYDDFDEKEDEKITSAINKYKLHYKELNEQGIEYLTIFKSILLLNILYKIAEVSEDSLAIPSRDNIFNIFIGSIYEEKVDEVLNYINNQGIINEAPNHYFEITTNALDQKEVRLEVDKIKKNINLKTILDDKKLSKITNSITNKVIREIEIEVKEGNIQKNRLISDLEKGIFKNPGYLHLLLFICKDEKELLEIKKTVTAVEKEGLLKDTIVVISESSFKEKKLNEFIEYKAKAKISEKHNYKEDVSRHNSLAEKLADEWVKNIRNGLIRWYVNNEYGQATLMEFSNIINEKISKEIFYKGIENLNETRKNANIWTHKQAKTQAEYYLNSRSYEELSSKLHKRFLLILQDNNEDLIVNSHLKLKDSVPNNHPIKLLQDFVDEQFEKAQIKGKFNLGNELRPLSKAPYGLYPSEVNIAALSFVMRKYINRIYDEKGLAINEARMKEKVLNIFKYWDKNQGGEKLYVRFGSEEEKKLIELLIKSFDLNISETERSINSTRWKIKEWIKENRFPLWLFNYSENITPTLKETIKQIEELIKPDDEAIPDEMIRNCYDALKANYYDFENIINSDKEKMLERYICGIDSKIKSKDVSEIFEYILNNMPEEIYGWNEYDVNQKALKWLVEKITPVPTTKNPNISLNAKDIGENEIFTATIDINDDATGNIEFYIDNVKVESCPIINGKAEYSTNNLTEGNHTIYGFYEGNNLYTNAKSNIKTFNVSIPGTISVNGKTYDENEEIFVDVETNKQTSINVYVDDEKVSVYTVPISGLKINLGKLCAGSHSIKVEYVDDTSINDTTTININEIIVKPDDTTIISKIEQQNAENVKAVVIQLLKENEKFRKTFSEIFKG